MTNKIKIIKEKDCKKYMVKKDYWNKNEVDQDHYGFIFLASIVFGIFIILYFALG